MFLLLLHPLDSWKVAMIFVSNIIHRVTFLFSMLFSFYWACQKFSSSCRRIIALSRCQIKLAKCLTTDANITVPGVIEEGGLESLGQGTSENPLISAGDDQPPLPPPAPIQHMLSNGLTPHPWPHPVIHAAQTGQSVHFEWSCHWWCFEWFFSQNQKNESNDLKSPRSRWYIDSF